MRRAVQRKQAHALLFFDASGQMTHLFNGVCGAAEPATHAGCMDCKYANWDYTLVAPLDV